MKRKICCFLLIFISFECFFELRQTYRRHEMNEERLEAFFENPQPNQDEKIETINNSTDGYLGVLEIPSISLKRGFYSFHHPDNTVEKNIQVISKQCLPFENCSFILASHSGSSNISFFKHLDQMHLGDIAVLYYQNHNEISIHLFLFHLDCYRLTN